jgi:serine/threonine-protein kinase
MAIGPGARVGPYEVTALLGEGGMGKIWRAHHAALKRDDALKVLPDAFVADPDRLARFHREAQVLASLNHTNIAHVYGLEDADGTKALVMELVEGPTLADRIVEGAIPLHEALSIAKQVAEGLEAAHEQGIVHRDLKPANIKVRPDGTVKVLDFGLAKAFEGPPEGGHNVRDGRSAGLQPDLSLSPTITTPAMTQVGVILGTAAYMSPEQAKGRPADKRSDIWSFGCVLYEMLTGRRAFDGEDVGDTLASVIKSDPDWSLLSSSLPPAVRTLVERCLAKDRRKRIGDIAVAQFVLTEQATLNAPAGTRGAFVTPPPLWRRLAPIAAAVVLTGAIAGIVAWRFTPVEPRPVVQFAITVSDEALTSGQPVAISPDGSQIVYAANLQLHLRSLADTNARPIAGTLNPAATSRFPVFSPDGRSVAFWSQGDRTIRKIPVTGGVSVPLCEVPFPMGLSWEGDWILFGHLGGISRVSANGGTPEVLATLKANEFGSTPRMLPGGRAVMFSVAQGNTSEFWDTAEIVAQDLASGERKVLVRGGSDARYLPTGHLVYAVSGVLRAMPFDLDGLNVTGGAVPIVIGVQRLSTRIVSGLAAGNAYYSVSDTGSLIYVPGPVSPFARTGIALIERDGKPKVMSLPPGTYGFPRVSPDGKRIVYGTDDGKEADVWVYELSGQAQPRRLTFGGGNRFPIWSADGERVAFQSDREGQRAIWWQRLDGTAERLTTPNDKDISHLPDSFAPDGRTLSYTERTATSSGLWTLSLTDKKATAFDASTANFAGRSSFSPDGRWLAYQSYDVGTAGVLVQSFPPRGVPNQIAMRLTATPHHPFWSRDGKELFYIPGPNQFAVVRITTQPAFSVSNAELLPRGGFLEGGPDAVRNIDVLPDGRFVGIVDLGQSESGEVSAPRINVVLNWFEQLKGLAPTK